MILLLVVYYLMFAITTGLISRYCGAARPGAAIMSLVWPITLPLILVVRRKSL